jgi:predicted nucleotidyltransferase
MKTEQKLLALFLSRPKSAIHLREAARLAKTSPSGAFRSLGRLEKEGLLVSEKDGPVKKYSLAKGEKAALRLAGFQLERFLAIPAQRREAIRTFLSSLPEQPVFAILFGSTAKGGAREDSDIDILLVFNGSAETNEAERKAEAQTGMTINPIQCAYPDFLRELKTKEDKVIASAVNTGIPLSNHLNYNLLLLSGR